MPTRKKTVRNVVTEKTIICLSPDVVFRKNRDGEVYVIRLDQEDSFFSIDGIAAEMFLLINGKRSIGQIKRKLITKHDPPLKQFDKDVLRFLKLLQKSGLIEFA